MVDGSGMGESESGYWAVLFLGVAVLCMGVGVVAGMVANSARRKRAMMRRNKTMTYAELTAGGPAWGLCEVTGTVRPGLTPKTTARSPRPSGATSRTIPTSSAPGRSGARPGA